MHGNYSDWSSWSECDVTCGNGYVTRTRSCDNPVPSDNGKNCSSLGPYVATLNCTRPDCPGNVQRKSFLRQKYSNNRPKIGQSIYL